MIVAEFIKWLETQDQEAEVLVVYHMGGRDYYEQGGTIEQVEFKPEPASEQNNWTQYFEAYTDSKGHKTILIGSVGN